MLVLPEPVMPWRRAVLLVEDLICLMAWVWDGLRGILGGREFCG